jgi:hypothetical protein
MFRNYSRSITPSFKPMSGARTSRKMATSKPTRHHKRPDRRTTTVKGRKRIQSTSPLPRSLGVCSTTISLLSPNSQQGHLRHLHLLSVKIPWVQGLDRRIRIQIPNSGLNKVKRNLVPRPSSHLIGAKSGHLRTLEARLARYRKTSCRSISLLLSASRTRDSHRLLFRTGSSTYMLCSISFTRTGVVSR